MTKAEKFEQFVQARYELADWNRYISKDKGKLLRQKIIDECEFPRSTLYQNPVVKQRFHEVEAELQCLGVLRQENLIPDTLLDEFAVVAVAVGLNGRLDNLSERMTLVLTAIEEVRRQVKQFGKG